MKQKGKHRWLQGIAENIWMCTSYVVAPFFLFVKTKQKQRGDSFSREMDEARMFLFVLEQKTKAVSFLWGA